MSPHRLPKWASLMIKDVPKGDEGSSVEKEELDDNLEEIKNESHVRRLYST